MVYETEEKVNIGKLADDTLNKVIKEFSGSENRSKIKVMENVWAFIGGAGGVGVSTVVCNLAYNITKRGLTVLVVDLNLQYPIQHVLFGVKREREKKDLVSFLLGKNAFGESIENMGKVSVMYANNRYIMDKINCDSSVCSKNMKNAINNVRHLFDVILFDCPLDLEFDVINEVLYNCDAIYSVWDEGISCVANYGKIKNNMELSGVSFDSKTRVIFNKKTNLHYGKYAFEKLGVELLEVLPFDTAVTESGLKGEIFCKSGASLSKNAKLFYANMEALTDKVLEIGGYGE